MNRRRVLIVDSRQIVRAGVTSILTRPGCFEVVGEASSAEEAVTMAAASKPDLVVMHLRLPDRSGVAATRDILGLLPDARILILGDQADAGFRGDALAAGAAAFLPEQATAALLLDAPRRLGRRDPSSAAPAGPNVESAVVAGGQSNGSIPLTPREVSIVSLIALGYTNRQIAGQHGLSEKTIRNYVSSLMRKLSFEHRAQLAVYAVRRDLSGVV